jgi:hypothetical protein
MASTSATQLVAIVSNAIILATTTIPCDEDNDIDFVSQFETELGTQKASKVDLGATWETLFPKLMAN